MGADPNPYAYVGGRTLSAVDPWGLEIKDVQQLPNGGWTWVDTDSKADFEVGNERPGAGAAAPPPPPPPGEDVSVYERVGLFGPALGPPGTGLDMAALRARSWNLFMDRMAAPGIGGGAYTRGADGRPVAAPGNEKLAAMFKLPVTDQGDPRASKVGAVVVVEAVMLLATAGAAEGAAAASESESFLGGLLRNEAGAIGVPYTRALTAADLGLEGTDAIVEGTFRMSSGRAIVKVDYLGSPTGLGRAGLRAWSSLQNTARQAGASSLRVETTPIIEQTGQLQRILLRLGFQGRANGTMFFERGL